jgi:hypothetical protein
MIGFQIWCVLLILDAGNSQVPSMGKRESSECSEYTRNHLISIPPFISPILSRLMWPAMLRKLFGPRSVPEKFAGFPKEMAVPAITDPCQRCGSGVDDSRRICVIEDLQRI